MRAGAEVDEVAVLETRDVLAFRDLVDEVEFEARGIAGALGEAAQAAAFRHGDGFGAGDGAVLELLVVLGDFLHLGFDLLEVVRGDPVGHVEVIVKAALDGRAVGELGVWPQLENGRGHDVGAGMAEPLQVGHLLAFVEGLAFGHGLMVTGAGRLGQPRINPGTSRG